MGLGNVAAHRRSAAVLLCCRRVARRALALVVKSSLGGAFLRLGWAYSRGNVGKQQLFRRLPGARALARPQNPVAEDSNADPLSRRAAIYASDLSRAQTTAKNVHKQNKTNPPPPFTVSPLLREQFFGLAEGEPLLQSEFGDRADPSLIPQGSHGTQDASPPPTFHGRTTAGSSSPLTLNRSTTSAAERTGS